MFDHIEFVSLFFQHQTAIHEQKTVTFTNKSQVMNNQEVSQGSFNQKLLVKRKSSTHARFGKDDFLQRDAVDSRHCVKAEGQVDVRRRQASRRVVDGRRAVQVSEQRNGVRTVLHVLLRKQQSRKLITCSKLVRASNEISQKLITRLHEWLLVMSILFLKASCKVQMPEKSSLV